MAEWDAEIAVGERQARSLIASQFPELAAATIELIGVGWDNTVFAVDGRWTPAELTGSAGKHAWTGWQASWQAVEGEHELACRATDAAGNRQPLEGAGDLTGFGNHGVHRIRVTVRR